MHKIKSYASSKLPDQMHVQESFAYNYRLCYMGRAQEDQNMEWSLLYCIIYVSLLGTSFAMEMLQKAATCL